MSTAAGPASIESLLAQGDAYAAKEDVKAAVSFYQAALKAAQARTIDPSVDCVDAAAA